MLATKSTTRLRGRLQILCIFNVTINRPYTVIIAIFLPKTTTVLCASFAIFYFFLSLSFDRSMRSFAIENLYFFGFICFSFFEFWISSFVFTFPFRLVSAWGSGGVCSLRAYLSNFHRSSIFHFGMRKKKITHAIYAQVSCECLMWNCKIAEKSAQVVLWLYTRHIYPFFFLLTIQIKSKDIFSSARSGTKWSI